jgi:serine/threonine-protein kinase
VNAEPASGFEGPGHMRNAVSFVSLSVQIIWFGFIVVYGVCVPNTARRCAFMMAGLALTHFGTLGASAWFSAAVREMLPVLLFWGCGITVTAMAMAVFGSLRLTALQKEVIEARPAMRELGQYQLQRQLGAGGMGEVYLAEHRLLKRPCAVKLIRPERAGDASTLRRFEREVRATTRLTHPNTIQIYDFGNTASGTIFYVMEYLSGLSLEEMVKRHGPLPPGRAVYLLRQLCGALHEAHLLGMVHRDLKPSNVMICEIGGQHDVAKLLDFGLVQEGDRAATQLTHEGIILGTPSYMSPEQVDGRDRVDARSDMYSLGATAYFALTGEPPFTRESALAVMLAHLIRGDCSP